MRTGAGGRGAKAQENESHGRAARGLSGESSFCAPDPHSDPQSAPSWNVTKMISRLGPDTAGAKRWTV